MLPSPILGNIALTNSQLQIRGRYSSPQLSGISYTNSTVSLFGLLNPSGETLTLTKSTGDWFVAGGVIEGPVNSADGTGLIATGTAAGSLLFMTLNAPLRIQANATINGQAMRGQTL